MSLNQIKRKITSIKSTGKITNAMCLIATTKLKKQRELFENVKDYFQDFYKIIHILSKQGIKLEEYNVVDNEPNTLFINVNSTMGLCGSYNAVLNSFVKENLKPNDLILQIGKQGKEFLINEKIPNEIVKYYNFADKKTPYNVCLGIANLILDLIKQKRINKVVVNYMRFVNALTFKPTGVKIFPIEKELFASDEFNKETNVDYEFNPSKQEILEQLLPDYIATTLYGSFIEAKVSEYASRRNAMDIATKNAKDLGEKYLLEYNNKRQAIITNEIIEIIGGSINKNPTSEKKNEKTEFFICDIQQPEIVNQPMILENISYVEPVKKIEETIINNKINDEVIEQIEKQEEKINNQETHDVVSQDILKSSDEVHQEYSEPSNEIIFQNQEYQTTFKDQLEKEKVETSKENEFKNDDNEFKSIWVKEEFWKSKPKQEKKEQPSELNINKENKIVSKYTVEEIEKRENEEFIVADENDVESDSIKAIMISLEKSLIETIINDEKEVIFLKRLPVKPVERVLIYSTKPIGKVIGEFDLKSTQRLSKTKAWNTYGSRSIFKRKEFDKYFESSKDVKLLEISGFILYRKPKSLENYKMIKGPSGFTYLK